MAGEQKNSVDQKIFLPIFLMTVLITIAVVVQPKQPLTPRETFATCLSTKGVTMYGSDTCPECQLQKGMFDNDFKEIQYINCDFHQDECREKGITKWPTWMYNGASYVGVQAFGELAKISGCAVTRE